MPFTIGQHVVWLNAALGLQARDRLDGRSVTLIEVEVIKLTAKRAGIRLLQPVQRVVWVDPANLRPIDDLAVQQALAARAGRQQVAGGLDDTTLIGGQITSPHAK